MRDRERLKVYVGGSSRELARVRMTVRVLEASGLLELTSRWFDGAEQWAGLDEQLDDAEQLRRVDANYAAIRAASIVWILWPDTTQSEGAAGELGYAAAHCWHVGGAARRHVVVSGKRARSSVGTAKVDARALDDGEALRYVLGVAGGGMEPAWEPPSAKRIARRARSSALACHSDRPRVSVRAFPEP